MKKIYILPELQIVKLESGMLIAASNLSVGNERTRGTSGGWVKENKGQANYDDWDDEW